MEVEQAEHDIIYLPNGLTDCQGRRSSEAKQGVSFSHILTVSPISLCLSVFMRDENPTSPSQHLRIYKCFSPCVSRKYTQTINSEESGNLNKWQEDDSYDRKTTCRRILLMFHIPPLPPPSNVATSPLQSLNNQQKQF